MSELTSGAIRAIHNDENQQSEYVVQVYNLKRVDINDKPRHRVIISDGVHRMQAMLAETQNKMVEDDIFKRFSIIRLKEFVCNSLSNGKILIILNAEVIKSNSEQIGKPVAYDNNTGFTSAPKHESALQSQVQASPSFGNSRNGGGFASGTNMQLEASLTPIKNLNPYQTRWTIKARVTQKSQIKKWVNARGEGQLFSVNLLDQTGEIKATAFNDQVDRLYNMFEEGKVYYLSKARVTMAKKQFSSLNNEYELAFEHGTEVEACPVDSAIPQMNYEFVKIADLEKHENKSIVDIAGVVIEDQGVSEIVSKATGKPAKKRELIIVDDSKKSVKITLWDTAADDFDSTGNPVVVCKGARVSDFNGRSLSVGGNSSFKKNPEIPEVKKLEQWFHQTGQGSHFDSYSGMGLGMGSDTARNHNKVTLQQVKTDNLGGGSTPDYFSFRGTVVFIKSENPAYPACPQCKKKVFMEENSWRCENCQKSHPSPDYRYILTASVEDATSQIYVSGFDDFGLALLKMTANELVSLKEADSVGAQAVFNKALFQTFNFKIRAKQESYNDLTRTKYNVMSIAPIDFVQEAEEMVATIDKLLL